MKQTVLLPLFIAVLLSSAHILPEKRAVTFPQIKSGNYNIANCGPNQDHIASLLRSLWRAVLPAIRDAKLKRASPAFSTFFSDITYAPNVSALLTNVSTGVAMDKQGSPTFFCATAAGQISYIDKTTGQPGDVYTRCLQNPTIVMNIMHGTPYIIVCPIFFDPRVKAMPPANSCLQVSRNKKEFVGSGASVITYRMWVLLEEIAHYYIYMTTKSELEVYDVNTCMRMNGQASSQNPHNYLFYVASLYGGCTNFPTISTRPRDRELLSAPDNSTDAMQVGGIDQAGYTVGAAGSINF